MKTTAFILEVAIASIGVFLACSTAAPIAKLLVLPFLFEIYGQISVWATSNQKEKP